jgi:hypothetical protein
MWTLREAQRFKQGGTWPRVGSVVEAIAGLQLWLDSAAPETLFDATSGGSLVAADGAVARWEDKSGNTRHMTQSTSANRPTRKTGVQGGKDVLRFDGSDDSLSVPNSTATFKFLHAADSTMFVVFKSGATANPGHGRYTVLSTTSTGSASDTGIELITRDSDPSTMNDSLEISVLKGLSENYPIQSVNNNFFPSGTVGLCSAVLKPGDAVSGNRVSLRRNGGTASTTNSPSGANQTPSTGNASQSLTLGRRGGDAADFNGDICEIIIYDSALSNTDRAAVESYLMTKWAIT